MNAIIILYATLTQSIRIDDDHRWTRARPSKKKTYRLVPVILFISIFTINQKTIASFTSIAVINGCIARTIHSINWIIRESRCALKFFNRNKFPLFTFCCWFPTVIWLVLGKKRLKSNYFVPVILSIFCCIEKFPLKAQGDSMDLFLLRLTQWGWLSDELHRAMYFFRFLFSSRYIFLQDFYE